MTIKSIKAYRWNDAPNWGDQLGIELIQYYMGQISVIPTDKISESDIIGIGSVLNRVPYDYEGIIVGAGSLKDQMIFLPDALVLGIRGCLCPTLALTHLLARQDIIYGDPGLLVSLTHIGLYGQAKTHDIGILPHWSDTRLKYDQRFYGPWKTLFINPFQKPFEVIHQIRSCKKLVTSSLHGIVVADAFRIPRRIVPSWKMLNDPEEGGMFKFADYMSALDMAYEPEVLETPDRDIVELVQNDLLTMYKSLPSYFNDTKDN